MVHGGDGADQLKPGVFPVHQEDRGPFLGPGQDQEEGRPLGPGGEPLPSLEDKPPPFPPGGGFEEGGIGPGPHGLGHGEGAPHLPGGQGLEVTPLLLRARHLVEKVHVALIGGGGV